MSYNLLFVDDDSLFLDNCKEVFAGSGHQVHSCSSVEMVLSLLSTGLEPATIIVGDSCAEGLLQQLPDRSPLAEFILVADVLEPLLMARIINSRGLFGCYPRDIDMEVFQRGVMAAVSRYSQQVKYLQDAKKLIVASGELEELTFHMEKTVEYHLQKQKQAYAENSKLSHTLKRTVRELEGRDRVLRHLLTIHKLNDTLQTILEVVADVVSVDCGVIHLKDENNQLQPVCVSPVDSQRSMVLAPSALARDTLAGGRMEVISPIGDKCTFMAVPICKGDDVLGVIEVCWDGEKGLSEDELLVNGQTIYTFTVHAAIAITDHNITLDKSSWTKTLDDVLLDFIE